MARSSSKMIRIASKQIMTIAEKLPIFHGGSHKFHSCQFNCNYDICDSNRVKSQEFRSECLSNTDILKKSKCDLFAASLHQPS